MIWHGVEEKITCNGQIYTLSRYSRKLAHELSQWVANKIGNPLEELYGKLDGFPFAVADAMIDTAKETNKERSNLYSGRFWVVWQSLAGKVFELGLLLRKYHPEANAGEIYQDCCFEHGDDYLPDAVVRTIGRMPRTDSDIEKELLQEWGLLPVDDNHNQPVLGNSWLDIDKAILKGFNLTPTELDEMTITELMILVESLNAEAKAQNKEDPPPLDLSAMAYVRDWAKVQKNLTIDQRLAIALRQGNC